MKSFENSFLFLLLSYEIKKKKVDYYYYYWGVSKNKEKTIEIGKEKKYFTAVDWYSVHKLNLIWPIKKTCLFYLT